MIRDRRPQRGPRGLYRSPRPAVARITANLSGHRFIPRTACPERVYKKQPATDCAAAGSCASNYKPYKARISGRVAVPLGLADRALVGRGAVCGVVHEGLHHFKGVIGPKIRADLLGEPLGAGEDAAAEEPEVGARGAAISNSDYGPA